MPKNNLSGAGVPEGYYTSEEFAKALGVTTQTLLNNYRKDSRFPKPEVHYRGRQRRYLWSSKLLPEYRRIIAESQRD